MTTYWMMVLSFLLVSLSSNSLIRALFVPSPINQCKPPKCHLQVYTRIVARQRALMNKHPVSKFFDNVPLAVVYITPYPLLFEFPSPLIAEPSSSIQRPKKPKDQHSNLPKSTPQTSAFSMPNQVIAATAAFSMHKPTVTIASPPAVAPRWDCPHCSMVPRGAPCPNCGRIKP